MKARELYQQIVRNMRPRGTEAQKLKVITTLQLQRDAAREQVRELTGLVAERGNLATQRLKRAQDLYAALRLALLHDRYLTVEEGSNCPRCQAWKEYERGAPT